MQEWKDLPDELTDEEMKALEARIHHQSLPDELTDEEMDKLQEKHDKNHLKKNYEERNYTPAESMGFTAADTALMGAEHIPEGAVRAGIENVQDGSLLPWNNAPKEGRLKKLWNDYHRISEAVKARNAKAFTDHPASSAVGMGLGIGATAEIPVLNALNAVRGASRLSNIGKAAVQGGITGAAKSDADLGKVATGSDSERESELKKLATDTGLGAGFSGAAQGVLGSLDPRVLRKLAEMRAVKAAMGGANIGGLRQVTRTTHKSPGSIDKTEDHIRRHGRDILDEVGDDGKKTLRMFDSVNDLAPRLEQARQKYGEKIGQTLEAADAASPGLIDGDQIAQNILKYSYGIPQNEAGKSVQERLRKEAFNFADKKEMTFGEAQNWKNGFKYKPQDADALVSNQDATNKIQSIITDEMESKANQIQHLEGVDEAAKQLLSKYGETRSKYQTFKNASGMATDRVQKNLSNRWASPSDMGVGAATSLASTTAGHGGVKATALGILGGLVNKLARERGSATVARTADTIAQAIENNALPEKYAMILVEALQRGPGAMLATHSVLMKKPDYQQAFQSRETGEQ